MSPFWSLFLYVLVPHSPLSPPTAWQLTLLEKIIYFSNLCSPDSAKSSVLPFMLFVTFGSILSIFSYHCTPSPCSRPWHTPTPLIISRLRCFLLCSENQTEQPYASTTSTSSSLTPPAAPVFYIPGNDNTAHPVTQAYRKGIILHPSPILSQLLTLSLYSHILPTVASLFLLTLTYDGCTIFWEPIKIVFPWSPCIRFPHPMYYTYSLFDWF